MSRIILALFMLTTLAGAQTVITIAEAREDSTGDGIPDRLNQIVTIVGVATCEGTLFAPSTSPDNLGFYVQDGTAGINVYGYDDASPGPIAAGDEWQITGEILQYNGLVEISPSEPSDFTYLGHPGVPDPIQLVINQNVSESVESQLLALGSSALQQWVTVATEPYFAGGGYNFEVWNGQTAVAIRVNESTEISMAGITSGVRLFLIGLGGQYDSEPPYDSGYQLLPRYQTDMVIYQPTISDGFHLTVLTGNPFAPTLGETINLEYGGPTGMRFTLTIFDRAGRDIAHLADSRTAGDVVQWDGTDDDDQVLPIGPYIVLLQGFDGDGKRFTTTETVVVAAPLN